jgi:hypothetical protein
MVVSVEESKETIRRGSPWEYGYEIDRKEGGKRRGSLRFCGHSKRR